MAPPDVMPNGYHFSSQEADRRIVDLRSDTVTKPTRAMREAMANAEVDDDVLGLDPTVERLQKETARLLGKEAGLFVPSGTMGNLICVLVHCEVRGSEVILGSESHIHWYEQGGISTLGGVHPRTVPNRPDGTLDLGGVEAAIRGNDEHYPVTRLICLENTHNRCGGRAVSAEFTDAVGQLATRRGLKLHIDGARLFNAAAALGVSPERLVKAADSVSVCLSKGLAAPVGSVIVGPADFIAKCRRLRKALGGGMRQVGVLAAAGLLSVSDMAARLADDHAHARTLAEGMAKIPGLRADASTTDTNIVLVDVEADSPHSAAELVSLLEERGVRILCVGDARLRLVTNYHISGEDVEFALSVLKDVMSTKCSGI